MNVFLLHIQLMLHCKNGFMGFVVKAVDALSKKAEEGEQRRRLLQ